jgi:hypothetical protein
MSDFKLTAVEVFDKKEVSRTPEEDSARLANLVTPYGVGTKSYNSSAEKRELDRQRAAATKAYEANPRPEHEIRWSMCHCRSFRFPHDPELHRKLKSDKDWRTWEERQTGPEFFEEPIR